MRIAIDPGHGMGARTLGVYDPGATRTIDGARYDEADIVLDWALALDGLLRERGQLTWWTRTGRVDPAMATHRHARAQSMGCDLMVSLHACGPAGEVWYSCAHMADVAERVRGAVAKDAKAASRANNAWMPTGSRVLRVQLGDLDAPADRARLTDASARDSVMDAVACAVLKC